MSKKAPWVKTVSVIVCLIVIAYMVYNAFAYAYSPLTTQRLTQETTFEDSFEFEAITIRDEKVLENNSSGTVIPLAHDGKRVAKGDTIAVVCNSEDDAASYTMLEQAKAEYLRYANISDKNGMQELSADKLNEQIDSAYSDIMDAVSTGIYDSLEQSAADYADKCASKQILTEGSVDISSKLTAIEQKINTLTAENIKYSSVTTPNSGYYINTVDGYESVIDYNSVMSLSAEDIQKAIESEPVSGGSYLGKIVESYRWYVAGSVDGKYASSFKTGRSITVNFPDEGIKHVTMKVESVKVSDGKATVILSSTLMDEEYANMRIETVEVITKSCTGYKVPSEAIRFDSENNSGIYVLRGKIISFINTDIIYSSDDYVIISSEDEDGSGVAMYDEVIVKGKDLKDGKVIK